MSQPFWFIFSFIAVLAMIFGLKQIAQDGFGLVPALSILVGLGVGVPPPPVQLPLTLNT